jgi:hypothetical protein
MSSFRQVQVGEVMLRVALQGEGPLVVLVHGFPESCTPGAISWAPLRPPASRPARSTFADMAARTSPTRSRPIVSNICPEIWLA